MSTVLEVRSWGAAGVRRLGYACKKRKTRRELFLERMEGLAPWGQIEERVRPHYQRRALVLPVSAFDDTAHPLPVNLLFREHRPG